MPIASLIRTIPDHPKQGIMFRDITTLLKDAVGLRIAVNEFVNRYSGMRIQKVAGIESRGFILGAPIAYMLGVGFVPIRKKGKLPSQTISQEYDLEYGTDVIEVHTDAINKGERVLLVDDLIATGGTAAAAVRLLLALEAEVVECGFAVDLPDLGGRQRLQSMGQSVFALCEFDGH
ncbi:MAG: adenine phosphoribosyltransferase [Betaproteobacteria bacterium]|jgi:adenine phosphoribosyltransferase|nr:adenine phosphoribosyltransferase [Betaproteobacteria bacterium]